jgi:hypothetical protein
MTVSPGSTPPSISLRSPIPASTIPSATNCSVSLPSRSVPSSAALTSGWRLEQFGSAKREWFDTFLTLPNGISVVLRHFAINLLKQEQTAKVGIKNTRLKVAWDERYLLKVIAG